MKPYGIIYLITNLINMKGYVGYTTQQIEQRWNDHIELVKYGKGYTLHNAIRKYGIDSFSIEQIDEANDKETLCMKEEYWIFEMDTYAGNKKGYNETWGGEGGPLSDKIKNKIKIANTGKHHTDETKKKLRDINLGKHHTDETKKKCGIASLGRFHSTESIQKGIETKRRNNTLKPTKETIKKIVETRKKNGTYKPTKETIKKIVETRKKNGTYKHSEETKRKISVSHKGKKLSEEHKRKLSESGKGKHHYWRGKKRSEETKRKISESKMNKSQSMGNFFNE
jgi:group I intron endonuclease